MVRTVRVGQRLLKPRMFVRGMVNNQIHQDADAHPFGLCDERFEILHGAKFGRQGRIIGNVVAVVRHRGFVYGAKPQQRDPQVFEIRQLLKDARKISDAISIAVAETFRVNLIDNFFLPPFLLHNGASLRSIAQTQCILPEWNPHLFLAPSYHRRSHPTSGNMLEMHVIFIEPSIIRNMGRRLPFHGSEIVEKRRTVFSKFTQKYFFPHK